MTFASRESQSDGALTTDSHRERTRGRMKFSVFWVETPPHPELRTVTYPALLLYHMSNRRLTSDVRAPVGELPRRPSTSEHPSANLESTMNDTTEIRKLALIGNDLPRKCGIATFTHDMYASLAGLFPEVECSVAAVNDRADSYEYGSEVQFEFDEQDMDSYLRAAEFLNYSNPDVVSLQHEYGIYGGPAGNHINALVRELQMPVVTTLHTVLRAPSAEQQRTMDRLCDLSAKVVVMTERGR